MISSTLRVCLIVLFGCGCTFGVLAYVDSFHDYSVEFAQHFDYLAYLALVIASSHHHQVALYYFPLLERLLERTSRVAARNRVRELCFVERKSNLFE